jgi:hypothetical protein
MTAFRLWFVLRHAVDTDGAGWGDINKLEKLTKLNKSYIRQICNNSWLIKGVHKNRIYYNSLKNIYRHLKLKATGSVLRGERITIRFKKIISDARGFKGYICKCYAEMDLDAKYKKRITKGRIGRQAIADYFGISRQTVIVNMALAGTKSYKNILHFKDIRFKNYEDYGVWLNRNMEKKIRSNYKNYGDYVISKNPKSYYIRRDSRGGYYLIQKMPNIYKFTGVYLTRVRVPKGTRR